MTISPAVENIEDVASEILREYKETDLEHKGTEKLLDKLIGEAYFKWGERNKYERVLFRTIIFNFVNKWKKESKSLKVTPVQEMIQLSIF